ncbi:conserved hypothetical protein [Thermosulfidibacter takaii ABI70S6]|uniref:Outer membrane protein n=1 Tax=Thermosulfidibacter takaii (strain DSM 17441 / JCM 13301 / NBRC 103674 / ABI70S6) TaxID=1298851 RepID=A0A0S3QUU7_THET7|nr:TIGR04219 family outer membrane beta-barrel protein [Thermosulfidibacter takaii]BAT72094.1 conserved hypothetical protein [Thermosulfidibacter takaii ABI70S6]
MLRKAFVLLSMLFVLGLTKANALVIEGGAAVWMKDLSGWVEYKGNHVDVEDDLGTDSLKSPYYWVRFEHPIPFFPNVKLEYTPFEMDSSGTVDETFKFGDFTYKANTKVDSSIQADQFDVILYYNPLPWIAEKLTSVKVSVGIDAKYVDGDIWIKGHENEIEYKEDKDFQVVIPMLYGRVEVNPLNLLYLEAEGKYIAYGGNQFYDVYVGTRFQWKLLFAIAGYRYEALQIDDISDVSSNVKLKGWVVGLGVQF